MELKAYLQILLNKWWVLVPVFLITFTATLYQTYTETPIYETSATYTIDLNPEVITDIRNTINILSLVSREEAIGGTFVEIASSRTVRNEARDAQGLDSLAGYKISANVLAGSTVMQITVSGPDAVIARDTANTVGLITIQKISEKGELFNLSILDEAPLRGNPISPVVSRNLALGAVFGLVLGAGLAFLAEYLTANRLKDVIAMNIMDVETSAMNKRYFMQRLNQEMIRAKRNQYPLSLALLKIEHLDMLEGPNNSIVRTEFLRQIVARLGQYLREEDLLAYLQENVFAILLLDTSGENAKSIVEYFQTRIAWTDFNSEMSDIKLSLSSTAGVVSYNHNGIAQDEFLSQAERALRLAAVSEQGRAHLASSTMENPEFDLETNE